MAPRPLAAAVGSVSSRLAPATPLAAVQTCWRTAVGDVIAAEGRPVGERAGVVTVACRSAVWAQELDLMSEELVGRLNAELGDARVQRLRCVVGPLG